MKKITFILGFITATTISAFAQIPNGGFETLSGWSIGNAALSSDHYPVSVGQNSIRLENQMPITNNSSYGYAVSGTINNGCMPSFPITGHPNQFCGYYKCFPLNNDTIQIAVMLFKNGVGVAGAELITTNTVSNWTSFTIPISSYVSADSATVTVAAFYNDTTCGMPFGPFGNSVLYVDNISFDNLITSSQSQFTNETSFSLFPNPSSGKFQIKCDDIKITAVEIYNLLGEKIYASAKNAETNVTIDISNQTKGIYFVNVYSGEKMSAQKIVVQ